MRQSLGRQRPARDRLIKAAAELFYSQGIAATGIDAITERAGVARKSLYNNFASKDDLVLAYIRDRHQEWLDLYELRSSTAESAGAGCLMRPPSCLPEPPVVWQCGSTRSKSNRS
jgi:AcrR family transcriptional regulator